MAMSTQNLHIILDSGASRVFNCMSITARVSAKATEGQKPPLLFNNRILNNFIFIKEPNEGLLDATTTVETPIRTKLYIPYDMADPYAGGQSVNYGEQEFNSVLEYLTGNKANEAALGTDLRIIDSLNTLPSLDPFLLRDKFSSMKINASQDYINLSEAEWQNIRSHISEKFSLMCTMALGPSATPQKVEALIDKIWEAQDLAALQPLLAAFQLPPNNASEIFYSWKGVAFFNYEYLKNSQKIRQFTLWLATKAITMDPMDRQTRQALDASRERIKSKLRSRLGVITGQLNRFNTSFDLLFKEKKSAGEFVGFIKDSKKHFWTLGNAVNGIFHAIALTENVTRKNYEKPLPLVKLSQLFSAIEEVL
jgi:hypothetical protein